MLIKAPQKVLDKYNNPLLKPKEKLLELAGVQRAYYIEYLRRQIVQNRRIDVLGQLLGLDLQPFHVDLLRFQFLHKNTLQLCFRGAGKSTCATELKGVWYACVWPDVRVLLCSRTENQAISRLKMITRHLETSILCEMFGEFYNKDCWSAKRIEISQRKKNDATPTFVAIGTSGSVAGAHFDTELSDDIVDKKNAWNEKPREEFNEWYNSTLTPMLDPPHPDFPLRYERHRVGTRYHPKDQYGRWEGENAEAIREGRKEPMAINIIPAIDPITGKSPWPARWPVEEFLDRKAKIGQIAFDAQYLCKTDTMNGEIFKVSQIQSVNRYNRDSLSEQEVTVERLLSKNMLDIYMGVDLAISEKETADDTAICVVGKLNKGQDARYYLLDTYNGKIGFHDQTEKIVAMIRKWKPTICGIESVSYQKAQLQNVIRNRPELKKIVRGVPRPKGTDKVSRAHALSIKFENSQIYFPEETMLEDENDPSTKFSECIHWKLRDQLVLFPNADHDDLFDAFDTAIQMSDLYDRRAREDKKIPGAPGETRKTANFFGGAK